MKQGTTIPMYSLPPQILTLANPRAVYKCLKKHLSEVIDPQMLITDGYLDVLRVDGFKFPNYPTEYISMDNSPHHTLQDVERKRSSSTSDARVTSPTDSERYGKRKRFGNHSNSDITTNKRVGSHSNSDTKPVKTEAPTSSNKHPTPGKVVKQDRRDVPAKGKGQDINTPKKDINTSTNVPSGLPKKPSNQCCLCNRLGHKAYLCNVMPSCTCGKPQGKNHDPFRCQKGPLTPEGAEILKTMKPKK